MGPAEPVRPVYSALTTKLLEENIRGHLHDLEHCGRPRWVDHLRSGIRDQPCQHGEILPLLKYKKLAGHAHPNICSLTCYCLLPTLAPEGSSNSPASASRVSGITGTSHHTWLIFFVFLVEEGFHHVGQAGLELLTSGWSTIARSWLTATSASRVQASLLPQPPKDMDEPGNHNSQQTDTRTENQTLHVLTHRGTVKQKNRREKLLPKL
ncbi:hypothetical protein AAY473_003243 [Plecturocebus cupreus]